MSRLAHATFAAQGLEDERRGIDAHARHQDALRAEIDELRALAAIDAEHAAEGADLNPFSTPLSRHLWQQGWDGVRPAILTDGSTNWRMWERGRQARLIASDANITAYYTDRNNGAHAAKAP